ISDEEIEKENVKRFELLHNQLFRAKIYKTNDETILFFDIHHIITDGESSGMLFKNFANAYNGDKIEKEVFNGYICSLIEEEEKNTEKYAASEKYFHDLLKEDVDSTILTPDLNNDDEFGELKSFSKNIDSQSLKEFCADKRISPNVLFMASTILTLNKYTFSDKTLLTTIFNGRLNSNYYHTQAFLVKTLPILSINENRNISIREFFEQTNEIWKNGIKHCIYPYIKISDEFNLKPEFLYSYNALENNKIRLNNNVYEINHLNSLETDYKVSFNVYENEDSMELNILYNDGLYSEKYINTFLDSIIIVLNKFIKCSSKDLENICLKEISIVERDISNVDELEFIDIGETRLNKIFEKQCELNEDKIILTASDGEFTYNDLNEKANRIANALIKKGIGIEDKVMFILKRNSNIVASIFGILKAGAAFIPVDSEYPQDRIEHVLSDSESKFIIVDDVVDRRGLDLSSCSDKLLDINELLNEENTSKPSVDVSPENLAYLIYTSGSTGLPKGVMIEHRNFANYVYPHPRNTFCHELVSNAENENYKMLSLVTVAFDTFLEEMLLPILNGVPVVFADDIQIKNPLELIPLIEKTNANIFDGTPSRLLQYLEIDGLKECIAKFKLFVVGGEAFPKHLYDILSKVSDGKIINSYGPTETTVACNDKLINQPNVVSVGKPVLNAYEEIMDIDSNPLPPYVLGELYVAGHGVSRAYLNRPEKNAEVYMTINGIKFYRSGDFAKWNENGEVEILGRLDDQIKLRGLRIEIGEIESAIKEFEGIKSLAVVVKKIKGNDHLCAYFTVYEDIKNDGNG
ncbi:MAG: amino acid adenylation domain-containing protein, partial [Methanobrevibacter sp.]|nr:amino acid adenylation domain-containing protein [Methanobrevibacter sp.]